MFFEITVRGAVQGVGFRPYIHALAVKLNIEGCVYNEAGIVKIFICAGEEAAQKFIEAIGIKPPEGAVIASITSDILSEKPPVFSALEEKTAPESFKILESPKNSGLTGEELPVILPDIGICSSCLKEMLDPSNRRYAYPLISCTACGPRYSIIKALPYDRERTSMSAFELCSECTEEYRGRKRPLNAALRHHAQTIGCHSCGPQYIFRTAADKSSPGDAIRLAIAALSAGEVVGLKGTGGYQLLADPFDNEAVKYLRGIKGREKKPFAVMFSKLEDIREYACASVEEERALRSPARPIVLLDKKAGAAKEFAYETAADSRYIGAFLPSIGIHRLLCDALGPLIVTSANISNEPIIISDEKFKKIFLDKIAGVLEHDREILSPADDSVVYNLQETRSMQYIRRARGYAPMAVLQGRSGIGKGISEGVLYREDGRHGVNITSKPDILSFGADLKAAFCMSRNGNAVLSQYFGDMENYETRENYLRELKRAEALFGFKPGIAVCDKHPLYVSSRVAEDYAKANKLPCIKVQHHHAHAASVMAERGWERAIGVVFDGTGYGDDGALWGGEFLLCDKAEFSRLGQLKYLTLCGGDSVSVDAGLAARCYLEAANGLSGIKEALTEGREAGLVRTALKNKINTIESSSMGRLFDAAAYILGIRERNSYEGECAMALENAATEYMKLTGKEVNLNETLRNERYSTDSVNINFTDRTQPLEIPVFTGADGVLLADQVGLAERLLCRHNAGNHSRIMQTNLAYEFHLAIIDMVRKICIIIRERTGEERVALSGGCFANRILLSGCIRLLRAEDFDVAWNEKVPSNDGGISLGQSYIAGFY